MRPLLLLFSLLSLVQAPAWAQLDPTPRRASVRIAAFTGVRVPYTTGAFAVVMPDSSLLFSATEQRGGNPLLGIEGEISLGWPVSLIFAGMYSQAGSSDLYVDRSPSFRDTTDVRLFYPGETWFARANLSWRLESSRDRVTGRPGPATDLFAGGGVVRMLEANHPALSFGFKGAFPLGDRGVEVVVGLEDFFVFWDKEALSREMVGAFPTESGVFPERVEYFYDTSNILLLRAGLSLRI